MLQIEHYQQNSFLGVGRDVYLKNQFYSFKWEGTYGTDTMLVFHFPVFREKIELLKTKSNQTKQKPQKLWLAGKQEMNLESINTTRNVLKICEACWKPAQSAF